MFFFTRKNELQIKYYSSWSIVGKHCHFSTFLCQYACYFFAWTKIVSTCCGICWCTQWRFAKKLKLSCVVQCFQCNIFPSWGLILSCLKSEENVTLVWLCERNKKVSKPFIVLQLKVLVDFHKAIFSFFQNPSTWFLFPSNQNFLILLETRRQMLVQWFSRLILGGEVCEDCLCLQALLAFYLLLTLNSTVLTKNFWRCFCFWSVVIRHWFYSCTLGRLRRWFHAHASGSSILLPI